MYKKDLGLGIGAIGLGGTSLAYFLNIPKAPGFFPRIVSSIIMALGVVITIRAWKKLKTSVVSEASTSSENVSYKAVALIVGYLVVYYFAFQYIGYVLPTFLLITATSATLKYTKWKILVPTALCVSVALYCAFTMLFNLRFPGVF